MKFIIFKVDCNHDIWVLEGRNATCTQLVD